MHVNHKFGLLLTSSLVIFQPIVSVANDRADAEWFCRPTADGKSWECVSKPKTAGPLLQPAVPNQQSKTVIDKASDAVSEPAEHSASKVSTPNSRQLADDQQEIVSEQHETSKKNAQAVTGAGSRVQKKTAQLDAPISTADDDRVSEASASDIVAQSSQLVADKKARTLDWVPLSELTLQQRANISRVCGGAYVEPPLVTKDADLSPEEAPIYISADSSQYQENEQQAMLQGDVEAQQGKRRLGADTMVWHPETKQAKMSGNAYFREPGFLLEGESADANFETGQVTIDQAEYVLHESGARGDANQMTKQENGVIVIDKGRYTTCAPGSDEWYLVGEDIKLNQATGIGTAKNVRVTVKDVPVLYLPYAAFPINQQRASGFLIPEMGISSDSGFELAVPYYWNIAPNYDATITPRILTKRGLMLEGEFRYLKPNYSGEIGAAFLPSDSEYDHENRWLLGWLHQSDQKNRWITQVDFTRVSDEDYFSDLDTSLNFSSQTHLLQQGETVYRGDHWDLTARVESRQTIDETILDSNKPYNRLPQVLFNGVWPAKNYPVEYLMQAEYVYFDRDNHDLLGDDKVIGHRLHLEPGIRFPFVANWGYFTPEAKFDYTQYFLDDQLPDADDNPSRALPIFSVDSGLYFDKMWKTANGGLFTQTLEPRLHYLYVPFEKQNDIPLFDTTDMTFSYDQLFRDDRFAGEDRLGDSNQLTLSMTTRVTDEKTGQERLKASIGQIFYFDDREISLTGNADDEKTHDDHSASAVAGDIVYRAANDWYVYGDILWDPYDNEVDQSSIGLRYHPDDDHIVNLGYRRRLDTFDQETIEQTDASMIWPLADRWSVIGRWNYDLDRSRTIETIGGLEYEACCWRVRVLYRQWVDYDDLTGDNDQGIFLQVQLKGLGGLGNQVNGVLDKGILGFREREENDNF